MNIKMDFLNDIYQSAQMGIIGIEQIVAKVTSSKFLDVLKKEKQEYKSIGKEAKELLESYGYCEKKLSSITKVSSKLMVNINLLKESSDSQIAKMMIEGTNKGIIKMTKMLNHFSKSQKKIIDLAHKLLVVQQNNLNELKKFL